MKINKINAMKSIKNGFLAVLIFLSATAFAQTQTPETRMKDLPTLDMSNGLNLLFISPEPIQFVDLSTDHLQGDLPSENIARVKIADSATTKIKFEEEIGVITVVGQSFMAQYKAVFRDKNYFNVQTNIQIQPEDMQPLEFPKMQFSNTELWKYSNNILRYKNNKKPIAKEKSLKMELQLNNIYVMNDYIFLDITLNNLTNLGYDIDGVKFSIEDKKIYKATNNQSIELKPVYQFHKNQHIKRTFRNIYVFKKFTYPNSKVLKIRLFEEQISGRTIEMSIRYSDVLKADSF